MTEDWPERADETPVDETPVDEAPVNEAPADPGDLTGHEPSLDPQGHVRTGNVTVDAVLASMEGLDDAPVAEHVAVFEHAHEQLRAALDGAAGEPAADG
jgi:hypothetical protein